MRYKVLFVVLLGLLISCSGDDGTPPTVSLSVSPESITEGQSAQLSWDI
jgi:hypothetical protein